MSGDFSRISFDPRNDVAGVLLQQGRVHLDSEWNEQVAQVVRRFQAGTLDTLGRAVVPRETADGFKILATGGKLTIGPGRIYVHGLLAENHGASPQWNPVLAELAGTAAIDYDQQPYARKFDPLPASGPHLVYLDVWQREVTHLQQPSLIEKAVGVDTSLRLQTAWQVKLLPKIPPTVDCSTPFEKIPNWPHAPSSGRLTTDTGGPASSTDPCLVPTAAGYKGLENQLYRVEVHTGGPVGTATFKWSRENASVATAVIAIPSLDRLEVESMGRDPNLGFSNGDWIEITDDWRELHNQPGELRRIKPADGVDRATRTIHLETPLPGGLFPTDAQGATDPDRHTRIRRWDQAGIVRDTVGNPFHNVTTGGGAIPVPPQATTLVLELGITVNFSLASGIGRFESGDYWVFEARTATATIEKLVNAPPRGIHHHYTKLAIVTFPDTEIDCRTLWPPDNDDCACTVCVTPAEHQAAAPSLQMAIDTVVQAGGGTVCLDVGAYRIKEPLKIAKAQSLRIVGKGSASELRSDGTAIVITDNSSDIVVERLAVLCRSGGDGTAVLVQSSAQVRLEQLQIVVESDLFSAIAVNGAVAGLTIRENAITAPVGVDGLPLKPVGGTGVVDLRIEDNQFTCERSAVRLLNAVVHQHLGRISGNRVTGCNEAALQLTGAMVPGFGFEIGGNELQVLGDGMVIGLEGIRIMDNDLSPMKPGPNKQRAIVLTKGLTGGRGGDAMIAANRISGFALGVYIESEFRSVSVHRNQIGEAVLGIAIETHLFEQLSIEGNQMPKIAENAIRMSGAEGDVAIRGNQIEIMEGQPGVQVLCRNGSCVYADNQSVHRAPTGKDGVWLSARALIVTSNRVEGKVMTSLQAMNAGATPICTVLGNLTGGPITVNGATMPAAFVPLNLQGV